MENKFFDVVFFCGLSALFTSLIWIIIGIVWSMIRKSKWIELGRELGFEEKPLFYPIGKPPKRRGSKVKKGKK